MPIRRLPVHRTPKPWGRRDLGDRFDGVPDGGDPIGEIWFDGGDSDLPLLVKYIFTSERLSVQVHPDDSAAQAAGYPRGKDEAWLILAADDGADVALGTREVSSREAIGAAAIDGSIVDLLDWHPVEPDRTIYNPAGTIHAIGAGVTLLEVQQNVDLTYRLYDYGRPRELHLAEATAVLDAVPFVETAVPTDLGAGRELLCEGGKFVMERWRWSGRRRLTLPEAVDAWFVPLSGAGTLDGTHFGTGECWLVDETVDLDIDAGSDVLVAYAGPERLPLFEG